MAVSLAIGNILRVKFYCSDGVQQAINTLHYEVVAAGATPATDFDALVHIEGTVGPAYKNIMSAPANYLGSNLQNISPVLRPSISNTASKGPGALIGDVLPPAISMLLSLRTAQPGRTSRGRVYLPFFPESTSENTGMPSIQGQTNAMTWGNTALVPLLVVSGPRTATLAPVIWSRKEKVARQVTSFLVRTNWGTQRRRSLINRPDTFGPPV